MTDFKKFIIQCENDLLKHRKLSLYTLDIYTQLSDQSRILCHSVINLITRENIDNSFKEKMAKSSSEDRILACRLIPLFFKLNSPNPTWSSWLLNRAVDSMLAISNINLSEIATAFLEILCQFETDLTEDVKNFCLDFSRELIANHRSRLRELDSVVFWSSGSCSDLASVAYLKYMLISPENYNVEFIIQTLSAFSDHTFFEDFTNSVEDFFSMPEYKNKILEWLPESKLTKYQKESISTHSSA